MKITFLEVHSLDHAPGLPIWQYSLPCAYLQAYLTRSPIYGELEFDRVTDYESAKVSELVEWIVAQRPDVLAASCYVWNWELFRKVLPAVKARLETVIVIAGGPLFDSLTAPPAILSTPAIDAIVLGEGEVTFKEMIEYLHAKRAGRSPGDGARGRTLPMVRGDGGPGGLGSLLGVMVRDERGDPYTPGNRPVIEDLDEIPSPYLTGVVDLAQLRNGMVALETQRGCPYRCAYCDYPKREFATTRVRYFPEARIYRELDAIYSSKVRQLYLMDATFNSRRDRCKDILRYIAGLRTKHQSRIAVNTEMFPELMDEEMLILCKEANLNYIEIGIQTMNPAALLVMDRPRKEPKLLEVLAAAIRHDVKIVPQLIIGLPGDDTQGFLRSFDRIYGLPTVDFHCFKLLAIPGTPYRARATELGLVYEPTPPYEVFETPTFSRAELARLEVFRKLALLLLPVRPTLRRIVEQRGLAYHEILDLLMTVLDDLPFFRWPVKSLTEAATVREVLVRFRRHVETEHATAMDDEARSKLDGELRVVETHIEFQCMGMAS